VDISPHTLAADEVPIRKPDYVRTLLQRMCVDYARVGEEGRDGIQGYRRNGAVVAADFRRQLDSGGSAGLAPQPGLAVDIHHLEHVAGIDKVRILDVRVRVPDLGPLPRLAQEACRDVPESISLLDRVAAWVVGPHVGSGPQQRRHDEKGKRNNTE
jgi:hypothetical protein